MKWIRSIAFLAIAAVSGPLAFGQIIPGGLRLVSSARVSTTLTDFTYQVTAVNDSGSTAVGVTATVSSRSTATVIAAGPALTFPDIAGGGSALSTNTFTLRQNRTVPFDPAVLSFNFSFTLQSPNSCLIGRSVVANGAVNPSNPCEVCNPAVSTTGWSPRAAGTSCSDGNACTVGDVCNGAGMCVGGTPLTCNDNNACTTDSCNPATGCVYQAAANGTACNDNNACTQTDSCQSGVCVGSNPLVCPEDSNVCTTAVCNPASGCGFVNNTNPCDDGNLCTLNDQCSNGICRSGAQKACSDNNVCTNDTCDPSSGQCVFTNNTASCSDGNACTVGDVCSGGVCQAGTTPLTCNDGNACTTDSCNPSTGCVYQPAANGTSCNDNNVCTQTDTCQSGLCVGSNPQVCPDDSNVCTTAACHPVTGCYQANNTNACDDGNLCTLNDRCSGGVCLAGTQKACSDNNVCTNDTCDPSSGQCVFTNNTASCSDGNACTVGDVCSGGVCQAGTTPLTCNDGNACTTDSCNPASGCVYQPAANGTTCNDNNVCTQTDTCQSGLCVGSNPLVCPDDNNVCTTASCHPQNGCFQAFNTNACDDGNLCTLNDRCSNGTCQAGTAKSCSDNNVCTNDTCDPSSGQCVFTNNTASCSDGNACTVGDVCSGGVCQAGTTPLTCNDGNACTTDSCNPASGCVYQPAANGTTCNDNNVCTQTDTCQSGLCVGSNPLVCPVSANACVNTICNPASGCGFVNKDCNDNNLCTIDSCDVRTGVCVNTAKSCNDNNACTTDTCDRGTGACVNTSKVCDDNNVCTSDNCDPSSGACVFVNNSASCSDGNACTANDTCVNGVCTPGTPLVCTNGNCNPTAGCVVTATRGRVTMNASCGAPTDGCDTSTVDLVSGLCIQRTRECAVHPLQVPVSMAGGEAKLNLCLVLNARQGVLVDASCDPQTQSCQRTGCSPETGACEYVEKRCFSETDGEGICNPNSGACEFPGSASSSETPLTGNGSACKELANQVDGCHAVVADRTTMSGCAIVDQCAVLGERDPANVYSCQNNACVSRPRAGGEICAEPQDPCLVRVTNGEMCGYEPRNCAAEMGNDARFSYACQVDRSSGSAIGICTRTARCEIGGVMYEDGTSNPQNSCEVCDAQRSTAGWTNLAEASRCTLANGNAGQCRVQFESTATAASAKRSICQP